MGTPSLYTPGAPATTSHTLYGTVYISTKCTGEGKLVTSTVEDPSLTYKTHKLPDSKFWQVDGAAVTHTVIHSEHSLAKNVVYCGQLGGRRFGSSIGPRSGGSAHFTTNRYLRSTGWNMLSCDFSI